MSSTEVHSEFSSGYLAWLGEGSGIDRLMAPSCLSEFTPAYRCALRQIPLHGFA